MFWRRRIIDHSLSGHWRRRNDGDATREVRRRLEVAILTFFPLSQKGLEKIRRRVYSSLLQSEVVVVVVSFDEGEGRERRNLANEKEIGRGSCGSTFVRSSRAGRRSDDSQDGDVLVP